MVDVKPEHAVGVRCLEPLVTVSGASEVHGVVRDSHGVSVVESVRAI